MSGLGRNDNAAVAIQDRGLVLLCEERIILASVLHQARVKVRAAASLGTAAARPVMAGSDRRYLSDASATDFAWYD
jgi:hypothetical protein